MAHDAASEGQRYLGRPMPRVEDRPLLTGTGRFIADILPAGTLHAAFLRSPAAHALIERIDPSPATELPGVEVALSAEQLPLGPLNPPDTSAGTAYVPARPLLAESKVRFVGEPLAVVVADNPYTAEDATELIDFDLRPLPAVVDVALAAEPGAPPLHEPGSNVLYDTSFEAGDVDANMKGAAVVVEREFRNPRYSAVPMENRGVLAVPEGERLVIWSSTQAPHRLALVAAELLGLDPSVVVVRVPDIGGGFGQKAHVYPEEIIVAWLARRLGRPVRWLEDRAENLLASSHARGQLVRVRAAADAEGRLLAIDADVLCDQGAYGVFPHGHILEALGTPAMIPGPYRLENYRYRARSIATNKAPEGAYRGVGLPVAAFVHERLMDLLACELGIDRAEIRRRNLYGPGELPHVTVTNQRYDSGDYPRALEMALDLAGYDGFDSEREAARREGRIIGLGISCYVEYTGLNSAVFQGRGMVGISGVDGAHVRLGGDGSVTVWTTLPAIGQGTSTTFAQLVADRLGVDASKVTIARSDTSVGALKGTGTFASRSAVSGGGAIAQAVGELRRRLLEDAADHLEAAVEDLVIRDGVVAVAGEPSVALPIGDLVAAAGGGGDASRYRVSATFDPPAVAYPYATHVCKIEIDPDTGGLSILRYVVVEDCGTVINPIVVEGQIHGAVAQGIAGTLYEQHMYGADGQLLTASLMDYLVPTASEIPRLTVDHLHIPAPGSADGAKGVGEGGTLAPPGALAGAVADALGIEPNELPLRPDRLLDAARQLAHSGNKPTDGGLNAENL